MLFIGIVKRNSQITNMGINKYLNLKSISSALPEIRRYDIILEIPFMVKMSVDIYYMFCPVKKFNAVNSYTFPRKYYNCLNIPLFHYSC